MALSHRRSAFNALRQGIKFGSSDWHIWRNYMLVSFDLGQTRETCRAMAKIMDLQGSKLGKKCLDIEVLERLVNTVVRVSPEEDEGEQSDPSSGRGLFPFVDDLITKSILSKISDSPRIFKAQAKLFYYDQDWRRCLEAHLKAYRCGIAESQAVETDQTQFLNAAEEVQDLVDFLRNLGPRPVSGTEDELAMKDWRFQARSLLRSFLRRTKEEFEDQKQWQSLQTELESLK